MGGHWQGGGHWQLPVSRACVRMCSFRHHHPIPCAAPPCALRPLCSCGTYGWGPLMRQAAPHEVTLLVLRSAAVVGPDFAGSVRYLKCTSVTGCV